MTHKENPSDQTNDIEISYKYNDSGIRTQKVVGTVKTNYHLVGGKVTFEENETDIIYYSYDNSDHLISMNLDGEEYFYIRNAQGDIIGLCDKNGAEVVSYSYDAFGKLTPSKTELDDENDDDKNGITGTLATTVGVKNPYLYRGYRYDSETGLYYLQSRYYNPSWGRFLNADAIVGSVGELLGHNVFAYCKNNVVNGKDPSGFIPIYTQDEPTDAMVEAGYKAMSKASKNRTSNASVANKSTGNTLKKTLVDTTPGLATGTLFSTGESFSKYVTIGKSTTKLNGKIKVSSITLEGLESSFNHLGFVGLGLSLFDNMNYGLGIGAARGVIDVLGFVLTGALISAFAASGGLVAVGIGLAVGVGTEVVKYDVTSRMNHILKKEV